MKKESHTLIQIEGSVINVMVGFTSPLSWAGPIHVNKWASARLSDKKKIEREFCSYLFNKFYINPFLSSKNHRYLARVLGKDTVSRVNTGNLNYSIFFFFFFSFHHVSLRFCLISLFFPFISF